MPLALNLTGFDDDAPVLGKSLAPKKTRAERQAAGKSSKKRRRAGLPASLAPDASDTQEPPAEFGNGLSVASTLGPDKIRQNTNTPDPGPMSPGHNMKRPRYEPGRLNGGAGIPTTAQIQSVLDLNEQPGGPTDHDDEAYILDSSTSFESLGLPSTVVHHLTDRLELKNPSKIQTAVLSRLVSPNHSAVLPDLLVRSETGSGKTLAYLLPIAHGLLHRPKRLSREDGTIALIIVPTHELVVQVTEVAEKLFRPWHWLVVGQLMGGEKKKSEKARLRKGITVLVATPGRLLDHVRSTKTFELRKCEWLVLDESDRLMDMGFEPSLKEIINTMNILRETLDDHRFCRRRTNLMLSATVAEDVLRLANFSLENPERIVVEEDGDTKEQDTALIQFSAPAKLQQHCLVVEQKHRLVALICLLRLRAEADKSMKAVVFFSTCDSVDFHHALFLQASLPSELQANQETDSPREDLCPLAVFKVHGNMEQKDRTVSFQTFRSKEQPGILFSTDAAARGLDLPHLRLSVQYDPPTRDEKIEYLHRAGRTARMGARGDALLFLLPSELQYREELIKSIAGIELKELSGDAVIATLLLRGQSIDDVVARRRAVRQVTHIMQECVEKTIYDVDSTGTLKEYSENGFRAYCRAYATHSKDTKHFFNVRGLHLGHVARSFGLREPPGPRTAVGTKPKGRSRGRHSQSDGSSLHRGGKPGRHAQDEGVLVHRGGKPGRAYGREIPDGSGIEMPFTSRKEGRETTRRYKTFAQSEFAS